MAVIRDRDGDDNEASITDVRARQGIRCGTVLSAFSISIRMSIHRFAGVQIASRQLGFVPRVQRRCIRGTITRPAKIPIFHP